LPVRETIEGKTGREGVIYIFDHLAEHPMPIRAYAWSSLIKRSMKRRFFSVLRQPPVDSPQVAVRAAVVVEQRSNR